MKDDSATTLIWALGAVAAICVFVLALVVVWQQRDEQVSDPQLRLLEEFFGSNPGAFDEDFVDQRLAEIDEPLGGRPYESFDEAEREAGYRIPRPSSDYALFDGVTRLETFWQPEGETAPVSRSTYASVDGSEFTLEVIPRTYDVTDSRSDGDPTTVGSKEGWSLDSDDHFFAWKCGFTGSGTELYCTVHADIGVDRDEFERFIDSVR